MKKNTKKVEEEFLIYRSKEGGAPIVAKQAHLYEKRYTVAAKKNPNGTFSIGIAVSGNNDSFIKKIGDQIAKGRAVKRPIDPSVDLSSVEGKSIHMAFVDLAKNLPEKLPEIFSSSKMGKNNSFKGMFKRV